MNKKQATQKAHEIVEEFEAAIRDGSLGYQMNRSYLIEHLAHEFYMTDILARQDQLSKDSVEFIRQTRDVLKVEK